MDINDGSMRQTNLLEVFKYREKNHPDRVALVQVGCDQEVTRTTFAQLGHRARVAAHGFSKHCQMGDRVFLFLEEERPFLEAFLGCLQAGLIPVPMPAPEGSAKHYQDSSDSLKPTLGIISERHRSALENCALDFPLLQMDSLAESEDDAWSAREIYENSPAYIQPTAGATGPAKNAVVTHRALMDNLTDINNEIGHSEGDVVFTHGPLYQGPSLLYGLLIPIYRGITALRLVNGIDRTPLEALRTMSAFAVTHTCGSASDYERYMHEISAASRQGLELGNLRSVLNTGMSQTPCLGKRFSETFSYLGLGSEVFRSAWGLAESCLILSITPKGTPHQLDLDAVALSRGLVQITDSTETPYLRLESSGKLNQALSGIVVDSETLEECGQDRVGEIWIANHDDGSGYWNCPRLTAQTFNAHTRDGRGPYLRSGDFGFFHEGQIYIVCKNLDLVSLKGAHYSPYPIEKTLCESHTDLRPDAGAVFSLENERLIAIAEASAERTGTAGQTGTELGREFFEKAARAVEEKHGLTLDTLVLLAYGHLVRGPGGKIQRPINRMLLLEESLETLASWRRGATTPDRATSPAQLSSNAQPSVAHAHANKLANSVRSRRLLSNIESRLIDILAPFLGLDVSDFDTHTPFSHYGMESATALVIVSHLQDGFGLELPVTLLFDFSTVATLTRYLAQHLSLEHQTDTRKKESSVRKHRNEPVGKAFRAIEHELETTIARELHLAPPSFGLHEPFTSLDLAPEAKEDLARALSQTVDATVTTELLTAYPTIFSLSRYLTAHEAGQAPRVALPKNEHRPEPCPATDSPGRDAIAIVGLGCRFPGADGAEAYWDLLRDGVDAISDDPPIRKQGAEHFRGGYINDIDLFDPEFFGLSARETKRMDPQQRLLLEMSYEALAYAGIAPDALEGAAAGVYIGAWSHDYERLQIEQGAGWDAYSSTGNSLSITANRISYHLDLLGPSLAMDSACSSSLAAIHLGTQDLRSWEVDLALIGGVNLLLDPALTAGFVEAGMMAPDGRCKTWDAAADGYVRSEGCGMIVLKRLEDAIRDKNPVVALIHGTAINQDGRSNGLKAPNGQAQEACIRAALEDAGAKPHQIGYLEAHGTGTELGDSIEFGAAGSAYGLGRGAGQRIGVGSSKTNLGHLESAAAMAGIIKTALTLQNGAIPPNLNFTQLSPKIRLRPGFFVPTELTPWPRGEEIRMAGVSSYGFGGVNCHAILSEAPPSTLEPPTRVDDLPLHALLLSAHSETALVETARAYRDFLQETDALPGDVCYTAAVGRNHYRHRLALTGNNAEKMANRLDGYLEGRKSTTLFTGSRPGNRPPRTAFMFTGQGSQYTGMGLTLYETHPGFRETVDRCDALFSLHLGESILPILFAKECDKTINHTLYTQVTLFTIEYALAELLISWGITPDALIGHSIGELVAACISDAMSLEDATHLVATRATLMQSLPEGGRMLAVFESESRTLTFINDNDEVSIAAVNAPEKIVLSGSCEAIDAIAERFEKAGIRTRPLTVSHPFHSAWMNPILDEFEDSIEELDFEEPVIPIYSNLTGKPMTDAPDATYWRNHIRQTIRFADGIENLVEDGIELLIEIGPRQVLTALAGECCDLTCLPMMKPGRNSWSIISGSMASLYSAGMNVCWDQFYCHFHYRIVPVQPKYQFDRQCHWFSPGSAKQAPVAETLVLKTEELFSKPELEKVVQATIAAHGISAGSIGQITGKAYTFLIPRAGAFCFFNVVNRTLMAVDYTGPNEAFVPLVRELEEYARSQNLELNLLETGSGRLDTLASLNFTTTLLGVWQNLPEPETFTLKGSKMRHLRYAVNKYRSLGDCKTVEYTYGSEPETDREVAAMITDWNREKKISSGFTQFMEDIIYGVSPHFPFRMFLVQRDAMLDAIILISPSPAMGGWLLDMEFYRQGMPMGCMELGILEIWDKLQEEGHGILSLGLTAGVYHLPSHPNEDPKMTVLLKGLQERNVFSGEANLQFKNKFRPVTLGAYICRPAGQSEQNAGDWLRMFAEPCKSDKVNLDWGKQATSEPTLQLPTQPPAHPLLHHKLQLAIRDTVFESFLDLSRLSHLEDHQFDGHILFPATGFIEMIREAAESTGKQYMIEEMTIQRALELHREQPQRVQLVLRPENKGLEAEVSSQAEDGSWQPHGRALLGRAEQPAEEAAMDRQQIMERCLENRSGPDFFSHLLKAGYSYGNTFRRIGEIALGPAEALALVKGERGSDYHFSPAVLDGCVQVCLAAIPTLMASADKLFLPIYLEGARFWRVPEGDVWAHARALDQSHAGTQTVRLEIFDEQEKPIGCIDRLLFKQVSIEQLGTAAQLDTFYHRLEWHSETLPDEEIIPNTDHWLIFADKQGIGDEMAKTLEAWGKHVVRASIGDSLAEEQTNCWTLDPHNEHHYSELLSKTLSGQPTQLVYLWSLDEAEDDNETARDQRACFLIWLIRALLLSGKDHLRLSLATRGAQTVEDSGDVLSPWQGITWGMARVLYHECTELFNSLTELLDKEPEHCAATLLREIAAERQPFAIAGVDQRRVARLAAAVPAVEPSAPQFRGDGTYLITGGMGALGLIVAEWLAQHGAGKLVLLGRRSPNEAQTATLNTIRESGAEVITREADVTRPEDLAQIFADLLDGSQPLRGIFHCAGALDDGVLMQQTPERYRRVLAAKADGAWALHRLSLDLELDHFVLFSSVAAVMGMPGQSSYASGNAFLDALAHYRKARNLPGLSINWGPWASSGMAAQMTERDKARSKAQGMIPINNEDALRALTVALEGDLAQVLVFHLNRRQGPAASVLPLLAMLCPVSAAASQAGDSGSELNRDRLEAAPEEERRSLLLAYLTEQTGRVLQQDEDSVDLDKAINYLGMDSLMVMELRSLLTNDLSIDVSALEFFDYPSIRELCEIALGKLDTAPAEEEPEPDDEPETEPEMLEKQVEEMSDEEVQAMLAAMMAEQDESL